MVRLVIWMSMYLRRAGSRTRLRFIPSGVNEAAFELHAQLPPAGSISQSRGAVVDPSSARFEVAADREDAGRLGGGRDANVADWHSQAALATSPSAAETMARE
jgi:hypothetical protein